MVFFWGASPSLSNRISRSCGVELTTNGVPGQILDLFLEPAGLGCQLARQAPQPLDVDPHAGVLHLGQHPNQGALDLVVQPRHPPGG